MSQKGSEFDFKTAKANKTPSKDALKIDTQPSVSVAFKLDGESIVDETRVSLEGQKLTGILKQAGTMTGN